MTRLSWLALLGFALVAAPALPALGGPSETGAAELEEAAAPDAEVSATETDKDLSPTSDKGTREADAEADVAALEFFSAMNQGTVDVKFIARSDHDARMIITNNTKQPVTLRMPEAFAGVPVVAQFGGGGGRGGGGGGRGGGGFGGGGGGGGQQSVGGGGGMMGGGGMGGGGGMFSIPPEETRKINFPVVCLDHGLRNPSSSKPYRIVPADQHVAQPAVVELLKAFGHGKLQHGAAQAAAWNLNNGIAFEELAAKRQGTRRTPSRLPYFSGHEIQAAIAYAQESQRLAAENAEEYRDFGKVQEEDRYGDEAEAAPIEGESTSDAASDDLASTDELSTSK